MEKAVPLSSSTALRDDAVLRRVRHLGSAHDGLREWRLQRLTAIALVPLGLYFVGSVLALATSPDMSPASWLASPVGALLVIFFLLAALAHALVGIRSVFADYLHSRPTLLVARLTARALAIILASAGVLAVLQIFLGR